MVIDSYFLDGTNPDDEVGFGCRQPAMHIAFYGIEVAGYSI